MIDLQPACDTMIQLLNSTADSQLDCPTPCSDYTVARLIEHIDEVARDFASIAGKDTGELSGISGRDSDQRRAIGERVRQLGLAWADPAAWQGSTALAPDVELLNEVWGKVTLTELVVHGWDLAVATGRTFILPAPTLHACLDHVVDFIPKAPVPALWGRAVDTSGDAPLIDRIVAVTGRNPRWVEAAAGR